MWAAPVRRCWGAGQTSVIRLLRQRPTGSCGKMAVSCQSIRRGCGRKPITADLALEQGRDVYALPGRVGDALSAGCNRLIRQGAGLAESPEEFVAELGLNSLQTVNKCKKNKNSLAKEENMLYSCVDLKPKNLEEILAESPFSAEKTMELLLNLLVRGVIREISRGLYVRERL